jgi:hypothetical protein
VLSGDADTLLLHKLQPQLKRLLLLRPGGSKAASLTPADLSKFVPDVPDSWLLPVRDTTPAWPVYGHASGSIVLRWELDVAAIRQAAEASASQQGTSELSSPGFSVLGGVKWGMQMRCVWDASQQGSTVGVYAIPVGLPAGSVCHCKCVLEQSPGRPHSGVYRVTGRFDAAGCGKGDFFGLGAMPGGFDDAAWVAKGLPTSGNLSLQLTVSTVLALAAQVSGTPGSEPMRTIAGQAIQREVAPQQLQAGFIQDQGLMPGNAGPWDPEWDDAL